MEELMSMIKNLTKEEAMSVMKKFGTAADVAQIIAIAKELGFELLEKDAEMMFESLNKEANAELSDDQLEAVSGGYGRDDAPWYYKLFMHYCECDHQWHFV